MTTEDRVTHMREFCERHDFEFATSGATQQEPTHLVAITVHGVTLRSASRDGLDVAIARMEKVLYALGDGGGDVYLRQPHSRWGQL